MPVGHLFGIFRPLFFFFKWDFFIVFLIVYKKYLYILNMGPLLGIRIAGTLSQSVSCLFIAFMLSDEQKTLSFW